MKDGILQKLFIIFYLIILAILAIINFGTALYFIPIIGEIATLIFIPTYEINFIITIVLIAISCFYVYRNKGKKGKIFLTINLLIFVCGLFVSTKIITNVNNQGEKISLLKIFEINDFNNVKVNTEYYLDSNNKRIGINVYHVEDKVKNKPVIIYIHGGGWIEGSKDDHEQMNKIFAKNGYVVISLDYDLSTRENNYWNFTEKQLLYGILWGKNNMSLYNGDINQLYMIGDSAGGNLALNLSYKINNGEYDAINEQKLPQIKAVSVIYPVIDLKEFYNNNSFIMENLAKEMVTSYTGENPNKFLERHETLNPGNFITEKIPPSLIIVGEQDSLVPPNATYKFIEKLKKNNVKNKLVRIPYGNHVGDNFVNSFMGQSYINNTLKWFNSFN